MPVAQGEDSYFTDFLELNYDVSLTVLPGQAASGTVWTFTKDWFGPRWRNFLIFAGLCLAVLIPSGLMLPQANEGAEGSEPEDDDSQPSF